MSLFTMVTPKKNLDLHLNLMQILQLDGWHSRLTVNMKFLKELAHSLSTVFEELKSKQMKQKSVRSAKNTHQRKKPDWKATLKKVLKILPKSLPEI